MTTTWLLPSTTNGAEEEAEASALARRIARST
jgi:hypothetical protein